MDLSLSNAFGTNQKKQPGISNTLKPAIQNFRVPLNRDGSVPTGSQVWDLLDRRDSIQSNSRPAIDTAEFRVGDPRNGRQFGGMSGDMSQIAQLINAYQNSQGRDGLTARPGSTMQMQNLPAYPGSPMQQQNLSTGGRYEENPEWASQPANNGTMLTGGPAVVDQDPIQKLRGGLPGPLPAQAPQAPQQAPQRPSVIGPLLRQLMDYTRLQASRAPQAASQLGQAIYGAANKAVDMMPQGIPPSVMQPERFADPTPASTGSPAAVAAMPPAAPEAPRTAFETSARQTLPPVTVRPSPAQADPEAQAMGRLADQIYAGADRIRNLPGMTTPPPPSNPNLYMPQPKAEARPGAPVGTNIYNTRPNNAVMANTDRPATMTKSQVVRDFQFKHDTDEMARRDGLVQVGTRLVPAYQAEAVRKQQEAARAAGPTVVDSWSGLKPETKEFLRNKRAQRSEQRDYAMDQIRQRNAAEEQAKREMAQRYAEQAPVRAAMQMMMNGTPEQAQAASQVIQAQMGLQGQMAGVNAERDIAKGNQSTQKEIAQGRNATEQAIAEGRNTTEQTIAQGNQSTQKEIAQGRNTTEERISRRGQKTQKQIADGRNSTEREIAQGRNTTEQEIAKNEIAARQGMSRDQIDAADRRQARDLEMKAQELEVQKGANESEREYKNRLAKAEETRAEAARLEAQTKQSATEYVTTGPGRFNSMIENYQNLPEDIQGPVKQGYMQANGIPASTSQTPSPTRLAEAIQGEEATRDLSNYEVNQRVGAVLDRLKDATPQERQRALEKLGIGREAMQRAFNYQPTFYRSDSPWYLVPSALQESQGDYDTRMSRRNHIGSLYEQIYGEKPVDNTAQPLLHSVPLIRTLNWLTGIK